MKLLINYILVALFAAVKFMGAPTFGFALNLSFLEVFFSTVFGGFFGFILFYNISNYLIELAYKKRIKKLKQTNAKRTKIFTRRNKFFVKIKQSKYGYLALILLAPSFISIPIGSILLAKFYNERKHTTLIMLFSVILCAYLYTYLNDFIFGLF